jgi:hypothetical protein
MGVIEMTASELFDYLKDKEGGFIVNVTFGDDDGADGGDSDD